MIPKATLLDIENLILIIKACASNLIGKNIYQWNAFYPNKEAFIKDLERRDYKQLEAIYFPNESKHPFYFYELIL